MTLGRPRLHLRICASTNARARELAAAGASHGTLVTADEQTAGRGRQGRTWLAPPGEALLMSLVLRDYDALLSLRAGLAVADAASERARAGVPPAGHPACGRQGEPPPEPPEPKVKWPNDVLIEGKKIAGVLVEGRPQEGWAVLGIGVNVAVETFPEELRATAASLGLRREDREPVLRALLAALEARLDEPVTATVTALRARDALCGRTVRWSDGEGVAAGIDDQGRLLVGDHRLESGEVHLLS